MRFSSDQFPEFIYPLRMRPGQALAQLLVSVGDRVEMGQCLAFPGDRNGARIHAAAPGRVETIESRPGPSGQGTVASVVVRTAPGEHLRRDPWFDTHHRDVQFEPEIERAAGEPQASGGIDRARQQRALAAIQRAGIVGHGGAGFPLHRKLEAVLNSGPSVHLIVNAVECEPPISCDQALLAERGAQVMSGVQALAKLLGVDRFVLALGPATAEIVKQASIGTEAVGAVAQWLEVESGYTMGDERLLLKRLFDRSLRGRTIPCEDGYLVVNVGTAFAVYRTLYGGGPLISRYVTLTDAERGMHTNVPLPIGVRIGDALRSVGIELDGVRQVVVGGHRMGSRDVDVMAPIAATTNCVIVQRSTHEPESIPRSAPCIRCGHCDDACPYGLPVQALVQATQSHAAMLAELEACTLCRNCEPVCPSHIPLASWFQGAKVRLNREAAAALRATRARQRFEGHAARRERRRAGAAPAASLSPASPLPHQTGSESALEANARDEVARAVARVRAKRARAGAPPRTGAKAKLD